MEANYYFTTQNGNSMTFEQYPNGDRKVVKFDNNYARHIADIKSVKGSEQTTEYMSFKDAAKYIGASSYHTLNKYIQEGLPYIVVGKSKRVSKTAIDKFMDDHTVVAKQSVKE